MLKLGSNRKTMGMGVSIREYSVDNKRVCTERVRAFIVGISWLSFQIGFGFCKGDDNSGGQRRKELDDFTKSLGKQMNLVMKRMEETKKVRMRLREKQQEEEGEKMMKKEIEKKEQLERISRNKEWREKKRSSISSISSSNGSTSFLETDGDPSSSRRKCGEWRLRCQLRCWGCLEELCPPGKIYQCHQAHSHCQLCYRDNKVVISNIWEMLSSDHLDLLSVPASSSRAEQGSGEHCSHCLLSWLPLSLSLSN